MPGLKERSSSQDAIAKLSVADIEQFYKTHAIDKGDYNYLLREKAKLHLQDVALDNGWMGAVGKRWFELANLREADKIFG